MSCSTHLRPPFATPLARLIPLAVTSVSLLVACGDEAPFFSIGFDTGAAADVAGDAPSDTGSTSDALPSVDTSTGVDAVPDAAETGGDELTGAVTVFETRSPVSDDLETAGITASFVTETATLGPAVATIGPCEVRPTSDGAILFEDRGSVDVGSITVSIGGDAHALSHDGAGYDAGWGEGASEAFDPGDAVTSVGVGNARLGSFSLEIAAPGTPEITAPAWELTDTHDREDDLQVQWSGSGGTDVIVNLTPVEIFPAPGVAEGNGVTCVVADTGAFTVPAAALDYLPEGGGFGGGSVALTVARLSATSPTAVSGGTVTLTAAASWTIVGGIP